jgi:hypothetical protein
MLRVARGLLACACMCAGCGRRGAPPVANAVRMLRRRSTGDAGRARGGQVGTLEAIKVKILIMGEEQNPLTLRIELTSENDLFFHFNHNLDEHGFRQVTLKADTARTHACTLDAQPRPQTHTTALVWMGAGMRESGATILAGPAADTCAVRMSACGQRTYCAFVGGCGVCDGGVE